MDLEQKDYFWLQQHSNVLLNAVRPEVASSGREEEEDVDADLLADLEDDLLAGLDETSETVQPTHAHAETPCTCAALLVPEPDSSWIRVFLLKAHVLLIAKDEEDLGETGPRNLSTEYDSDTF
eukprot:5807868-Amphidinium_carterae.2